MPSTRSVISPLPFAANALTVIPPTPVAGVSYRDPIAGPASSEDGWPYAERVNSAEWNQIMYQISSLIAILDKKGALGWSDEVDYSEAAIAFGSDGVLYNWLQASGPNLGGVKDPAAGANPLYWKAAVTSIPASTDGIKGSSSNLKVTVSGTNAVVVITADSICVKNSSDEQHVLNNVSIPSLNLATNGVNGLDTGSMTANTWYNYGIMWNPTTLAVAGIAWLTSSVAPSLPAGYTHWGFIDAVRVGATNTRLLPLENINGDVTYKPAAGTDMPNDFVIVAAGSPPTNTAVSLQSTAPPHAASAKLAINHSGNTTGFSAVYLGPTSVPSGLLVVSTANGGAGTQIRQQFESSNPYANGIYYAVGTNGTATILSRGWRS